MKFWSKRNLKLRQEPSRSQQSQLQQKAPRGGAVERVAKEQEVLQWALARPKGLAQQRKQQ